MKRIYETACDERRESAVAVEISKKWKCDSIKFGEADNINHQLSRNGKVMALCEIRCLNLASFDHPSFMIPYENIKKARIMAQQQRVPAFIVVHYEDDIRYINVEEIPNWLAEGGRVSEDEPRDMTEVAHYEMERLKSIYPIKENQVW